MNSSLRDVSSFGLQKAQSTEVKAEGSVNRKQSFELKWSDLSHSYSKSNKFFSRDGKKHAALQNCNGQVKSATLTAILGPSGAGKSTLLNCITGRIKPSSGRCYISAPANLIKDLKRSRIDYVPQTNEFFTLLSVRETLLFASRMNNVGLSKEEHMSEIERLIGALDMSDKLDWPLIKLSGGQMKRVAIACGLITRPAVIVLDEPTSGLDSDNAERLVMHLKSLVTSQHLDFRPAVLLTIHSPSIGIFRMFDQVYILSRGGHNIYQGAPDLTISHFKSFGFTHARGNPADWCIDVANGKFGVEKFSLMADQGKHAIDMNNNNRWNNEIEVTSMRKQSVSMFLQIWLLTWRSLLYYSVQLPQIEVRIFCHTFGVFIYIWMQKDTTMRESLCTEEATDVDPSFLGDTAIATTKVGVEFMKTYAKMGTVVMLAGSLLLNLCAVSEISAAFLINLHRKIYHRELNNSWYTKTSFFIAKLITDAVLRFSAVSSCAIVLCYATYGAVEVWRILTYLSYAFLLATIWENISSTVTVFFPKRSILELIGVIMIFDWVDGLLIDFLAHKAVVQDWVLTVKKIFPRANTYGAMLISFYGFGRCKTPAPGSVAEASMIDFKGPREMTSHLWRVFNLTKEKTVDLFDIYDLDEEVSAGFYDSFSAWAGSEDQAHQRHPSKVLQFFGYNESEIVYQTSVMLAWICITSILYACVVRKRFS